MEVTLNGKSEYVIRPLKKINEPSESVTNSLLQNIDSVKRFRKLLTKRFLMTTIFFMEISHSITAKTPYEIGPCEVKCWNFIR